MATFRSLDAVVEFLGGGTTPHGGSHTPSGGRTSPVAGVTTPATGQQPPPRLIGIVGPPGLPAETRDTIREAALAAMHTEDFRTLLERLDMTEDYRDSAAYGAFSIISDVAFGR